MRDLIRSGREEGCGEENGLNLCKEMPDCGVVTGRGLWMIVVEAIELFYVTRATYYES